MALREVDYNLNILKLGNSWIIVEPIREKVLCVKDRIYACYISTPIQFKTFEAAEKWVQSGTIAELQEGLGTLHIGFTNSLVNTQTGFDGERRYYGPLETKKIWETYNECCSCGEH